jgi:hypothetical protein
MSVGRFTNFCVPNKVFLTPLRGEKSRSKRSSSKRDDLIIRAGRGDRVSRPLNLTRSHRMSGLMTSPDLDSNAKIKMFCKPRSRLGNTPRHIKAQHMDDPDRESCHLSQQNCRPIKFSRFYRHVSSVAAFPSSVGFGAAWCSVFGVGEIIQSSKLIYDPLACNAARPNW